IIGAIGTAVITPLTRDVAANERLADMRLREIETQFRWMSDVTNMREREADRRIALLWQKVYQETLPPASLEAAARASRHLAQRVYRPVGVAGPAAGGGGGARRPRAGRALPHRGTNRARRGPKTPPSPREQSEATCP